VHYSYQVLNIRDETLKEYLLCLLLREREHGKELAMGILKKIRSKMNIHKTAQQGKKSQHVEREELSPLDIIMQDTDVLTDDREYVFTLPPAPLDIADYLAHYFQPAEKTM
jgi:hypothetical protein